MNIFEDLIDELKEENLLEETVIETRKAENEAETVRENNRAAADALKEDAPDLNETDFEEAILDEFEPRVEFETSLDAENIEAENIENDLPEIADSNAAAESVVESSENLPNRQSAPAAEPDNQIEFFRKRAVEEVSGLQTVEHVFSGLEREQKKTVPKPYDDLKVKKALHSFLQVSADLKSPEHAQAEFQLMQETESWYSALSHRDKQISITHLRRYCETTKPVLSSRALIALARFYRNSPYSEAVRSKFDLIVTRLFSKDLYDQKREIAFAGDELVNHLSELYAEWESLSLYSNEEDEAEILPSAFKFEDFISEAEKAESFDELIRNDFFNRLRSFKESTGDRFFSPLVTAAAIESNIRIGNRYIELLEQEKANGEIEKLENKYGFLHDQVISDATSKSLQLVDLLKNRAEKPQSEKPEENEKPKAVKAEKDEPKREAIKYSAPPENVKDGFLSINKWLIAAAIAIFVVSVWLYFGSKNNNAPDISARAVKKVNLDNSSLREYIKDARIGNDTFYAVVLPAWDSLNQERKEEILKKIAAIGNDKGFKNVNLLDAENKPVGTAAENSVVVTN